MSLERDEHAKTHTATIVVAIGGTVGTGARAR